jgi:23S rRNA (uracil1939-C5)-methyltransferase
MKKVTLRIDSLASGGSGVGRVDGKACFVPFTVPGDLVQARLVREHRSWNEAELLDLLEPSADRVQPVCPVYGQCGGCNWQHISYKKQCQAKQQILTDSLQRIARLDSPPVNGTIAAEQPLAYRSRVQFKLHSTEAGLAMGFFRKGTRFVIDLPAGCPVATTAINQAASRLKSVLFRLPDRSKIPQISLEDGLDGVTAIVHYIGSDVRGLADLLLSCQGELGLAGLFLQTARKESLQPVFGSETIRYQVPVCGNQDQMLTLGYSIGGFAQVNRQQNQQMIRLVCGSAKVNQGSRVLDLYCGNGNLSLPFAFYVAAVNGLEEYPASIASAVDNAEQLRVNNSSFKCIDASEGVRQLLENNTGFDLVLLDPPRQGAFELANQLDRLGALQIIYVSCDPATLARDIRIICSDNGYKLVQATPLDMFPQTSHLETVALLVK